MKVFVEISSATIELRLFFFLFLVTSSNELDAFELEITDLRFRKEDGSVDVEDHDVGGDLAFQLFRLESDDHLVLGSGDELETGIAVRGRFSEFADVRNLDV